MMKLWVILVSLLLSACGAGEADGAAVTGAACVAVEDSEDV